MAIELRELNPADEKAFYKGLQEWSPEDISWYTFSWKPGMSYSEMLGLLENDKNGLNLAPGRVPHTMLYGFYKGEIVGRVSVRHELNENLQRRGGHVGYSVAARFRNKGFATSMVGQALEYCKKIGLESILITCADDNEPSWKIIEHFGGEAYEKVWDEEDEEMIRKYWVKLK